MELKFSGRARDVQQLPDHCPQCHHAIEPKFLHGIEIDILSPKCALQAALQCPRHDCGRMFTATYGSHQGPVGGPQYFISSTGPRTFQAPEVSDEIAAVSPDYPRIKAQAAEAEDRDLEQIAGPGYRKALEFLVKDYCTSLYEEDDKECDAIRKGTLSHVIKTYVESENIKQCARLASWLGNDEVHYVRKWTAKDINDLKTLMRLTEDWIEAELLTAQYVSDMSGGGANES